MPEVGGIDPRGPRFAAALTSVVLALTLVTGSGWLLTAQTVVFAIAAGLGLAASPYAMIFRRWVRPRLQPPTELEDPRPPRFAQLVGLLVAGIGVLTWAFTGSTTAVIVAAALALIAAFLNAAFGLCLGCELYLIGRRALSR